MYVSSHIYLMAVMSIYQRANMIIEVPWCSFFWEGGESSLKVWDTHHFLVMDGIVFYLSMLPTTRYSYAHVWVPVINLVNYRLWWSLSHKDTKKRIFRSKRTNPGRCEEMWRGPFPKPFNPMAPMNLYVSVCIYRVACMSVYPWANESYPMFSAQ